MGSVAHDMRITQAITPPINPANGDPGIGKRGAPGIGKHQVAVRSTVLLSEWEMLDERVIRKQLGRIREPALVEAFVVVVNQRLNVRVQRGRGLRRCGIRPHAHGSTPDRERIWTMRSGVFTSALFPKRMRIFKTNMTDFGAAVQHYRAPATYLCRSKHDPVERGPAAAVCGRPASR